MRVVQAIEMASAVVGVLAAVFGVSVAGMDGGSLAVKAFVFLAFVFTMIWLTEGDNDD